MKRLKRKHYQWHHRRPSSIGGKNVDKNMSHVTSTSHQAWHTLFCNYTAQEIAKIINDTWLDPAFEFRVFERRLK